MSNCEKMNDYDYQNRGFSLEKTKELASAYIDKVIWGGQLAQDFAKENNISATYTTKIRNAITFARNNDLEKIKGSLGVSSNYEISVNLLVAAYDAINMTMPKEVKDAIDEFRKEAISKKQANLKRGQKSEKNITDGESKENKQTTPLWAQSMLLNQAKAIEMLGDLNDAVIPKYAKDIVDALNKLDTHMVAILNKL